ncbi:MAG: glutamine-hydrolyzing carbamoyl-phosphate synthase small subunit [Rhodospirillales bacterium]|jgi:carbamoyl-phosphate synthase small subunit|nr:glutamine-hydrolyzing carbamoyl-phosphate synthase small subunit [Rhodospirillales bacterium]
MTDTVKATVRPPHANAALVLHDGEVYWGIGAGAPGTAVGEVCFNTSITGYQEILTDPSYAGQIITFTFPHVGNVGTNPEDIETVTPAARGCILGAAITEPSNWRAARHLDEWLRAFGLSALTGVDTRRLTRRIRDGGAPNGALVYAVDGDLDLEAAFRLARDWPGLEGMDLAKEVTCAQTSTWHETTWTLGRGYGRQDHPRHHVVAVDFGAKRNILRCLANTGCRVTVVTGTSTAEDVLALKPDGVFLSNGPGDPAATGAYAVPMIRELMKREDLPIFGICLGHQMLALALGGRTRKMHLGHRGANHPVKDLATSKVEITSQNHGFVVERDSLPKGVTETHVSLFDGSNEGLKLDGRPVFSVQYHPEASPGPQDSHHLFTRFIDLIAQGKR